MLKSPSQNDVQEILSSTQKIVSIAMICQILKIVIMCSSESVRSLLWTVQICISSLNFRIKHSEPFKPIIVIFVSMFFIVEISGTASSALLVITVLDVSDSEIRNSVFSINNIRGKTISKL